jgi:outer membrane protein
MIFYRWLLIILCCLFCCAPTHAARESQIEPNATQLREPIGAVYSLSATVDTAMRNYPTLRRARAKLGQRGADVSLAKTAYLPQLDVLAQEVLTTTNNVAGTIFPQPLNVVPTQTGPANDTSSMKSVFANSYGTNFSWMIYDWGQRHSTVVVARSQVAQANEDIKLTELDVAAASAGAYLANVETKVTIKAQQATVDRMQAWNLVVHTLVDKGLRAGVDAARADADLSNAKILLIESERAAQLASVDLAETMGLAGTPITIDDTPWTKRQVQNPPFKGFNAELHPLALLRSAEVDTAHAQIIQIEKSYRPRLWFHSGIWSRGSGSRIDAHPVADGTLPQNANYVVGFGIDFPIMNYYPIKAKERGARQNELAEHANYDLAIQEITRNNARARVLLDNARRLANETPVLITAARDNEMKASERYRVGLSNVLEVAEAQRILQNALVQDAVAQVRIWRALLAAAYANGDLKPFMELAKQTEASSK